MACQVATSLLECHDALTQKRGPHVFLMVIAARPEQQGKGLGESLLLLLLHPAAARRACCGRPPSLLRLHAVPTARCARCSCMLSPLQLLTCAGCTMACASACRATTGASAMPIAGCS